jgi:RNA polymerase sigma-70 factor (ECF subfamily)
VELQDLPAVDPAARIKELLDAGNRQAAYEHVVLATKDSLFRYLRCLLRSEDLAREAFQETYLRVFRNLGGFRGEASVTTWVLTIGRNLALNVLRGQRTDGNRIRSLELDQTARESVRVDDEPAITTRRVRAAVDALPSSQREAVLLFYVEDRSLKEVAALTGRPINTVKSDLKRSREHLRASLEGLTSTPSLRGTSKREKTQR